MRSGFILMMTSGMILFSFILTSAEKKEDIDRIVITAEDIKKMNVWTVVDVLNKIPGVDAGESSVSLRGSSMIRVLLDGRPINDPLSTRRAIKWGVVSLDSIEKIEIYMGGGVVLFGDDSSGGVINITTKRIKATQVNVEAYWGNFNTQSYSLNYRQKMKRFGLGLSGGWDKTDGFRENSDKDTKRIGTKISYSPHDEYTFDLSSDYAKEDRGMPGLPAFPTLGARSEDETFGSSLLCNIGRLRSSTHFSYFENEHRNPETNLETILQSWSLGEDLKSKFCLPELGLIEIGANVETAHVKGNKIESRHEDKYGIYVTKALQFKKVPLTIDLGLRWNLYSEFPQVVNPEMKLSFERGSLAFRGTIVKTNNIPTFLQRYYETSTNRPNPDLGMEKAMNYSTSLLYHLEKSFEGGITFFFNRVQDCITFVRKDGGIGSYENIGEVTIKGGELSLRWKPTDIWEIKPSYTYLSAKDEKTDNWLPAKPAHQARFDIRYKPLPNLTLGMDTKYVSRQYTRSDNKESVPGYFLADFTANYCLKKVRIFLKVENLFDKDYYYGCGRPAPPLAWKAGLSYEF